MMDRRMNSGIVKDRCGTVVMGWYEEGSTRRGGGVEIWYKFWAEVYADCAGREIVRK
jgi:hypothetical protein